MAGVQIILFPFHKIIFSNSTNENKYKMVERINHFLDDVASRGLKIMI